MQASRNYSCYSFLTSELYKFEWSASPPGRALPLGKGPPSTHCTGGCVGLRAGLDKRLQEETFASAGDRTPVVYSIACLLRTWKLLHRWKSDWYVKLTTYI
jgi:hypothetical protein